MLEEHLPLVLESEYLIKLIKATRGCYPYYTEKSFDGKEEVGFYVEFPPDNDRARRCLYVISKLVQSHFHDFKIPLDYKIWTFPDHLPTGAFSLRVRDMTRTLRARRDACHQFVCLVLDIAPFSVKDLNRHLANVIWGTREEEQWGPILDLPPGAYPSYQIKTHLL